LGCIRNPQTNDKGDTMQTEKSDVYTRVTNKIVADLERGNLTWLQPWQAGHQAGPVSRPLRAGGKAYRGVNVLMLWAAAIEKGYSCPLWLTYKQASELGGQVRKGEHGSLVVYADNEAFYVKGTRKALLPVMAETKPLIATAEGR
jgi:antirestriction protein ArdC